MSRFADAVRRSIYVLECPMHAIANGAHLSRGSIYDVMHGRYNTRPHTAQALTGSIKTEIDRQIQCKQMEIDNMVKLKTELEEAFDAEYGHKGGVQYGC